MNRLKTHSYKTYSDRVTPVGMYLNLRDLYPQSILLESSEVDDENYSHSILCADPIASISLNRGLVSTTIGAIKKSRLLRDDERIQDVLKDFIKSFEPEKASKGVNGFFGFQSFEAVRYFESKNAALCPDIDTDIPILDYRLYRYVVSFNHFNGELHFIENSLDEKPSVIHHLVPKLMDKQSGTYVFSRNGEESQSETDEHFLKNVSKAKEHCHAGDVFQMVLSRQYKQGFQGDEFNVYRALRHVNPSPYMFYFDYGSFKLFGSSPEAQIQVRKGEATINPIAGTYRRTGDKEKDDKSILALQQDEKELAEHAMLVDLARNDLNRHCDNVHVAEYKEIHQYSHVIHMVSKVQGDLNKDSSGIDVLADTFPAGTLSGAPKVRAIQLLAEMESRPRGVYGGSVGFIEFDGDVNQAIVIRSFLVKGNHLYYQAGAGVVLDSVPESELQEVHNKLGALRHAMQIAEEL
ncbi:MAG: anthranilate synthase component I family protein [Flavobacteriales bacterium]|nr:anthranilate synthase component I family protein [Flavobacteriales bacterium]